MFYFFRNFTSQKNLVPDSAQTEAYFVAPAVLGRIQERSMETNAPLHFCLLHRWNCRTNSLLAPRLVHQIIFSPDQRWRCQYFSSWSKTHCINFKVYLTTYDTRHYQLIDLLLSDKLNVRSWSFLPGVIF
jgi:hypothetical protein